MVAVRIFNEQRGDKDRIVYGIATTGINWKFLKLAGVTAAIDLEDYHIREADRVIGIIVAMLRGTAN